MKAFWVIVAVIVMIGGVLFFRGMSYGNSSGDQNSRKIEVGENITTNTDNKAAEIPPSVNPQTEPSFTIEGGMFYFKPNEIRVKKGETVKITFKNIEGTHDFVLDEFKVKSSVIGQGEEETVQFTADKIGAFEYYCSVGNHREMGMKGKLIVE